MRALLLAGLLLIAAATAQTTASDTVAYTWVVDEEDPADDQTGPTPASNVATPNDGNPESDIRRVQMTDDGTTFVAKITMGTCDFGVPNGFALVILELTAGGADLEMTASYKDGCADARAAESDSLLGDGDSPIAGLRIEAVPSESAIYLFSDYASNGLVPGDTMSFDRIHTGRQFTEPGRYTFGLDEASGVSFTVGSGAPAAVAPVGQVVSGDLVPGTVLEFDNATSDTYLLNWTGDADLLVHVAATNGSVHVAFDGNTTTASNHTLEIASGQPGVLNLSFDGFTGTVTFEVPTPPLDGPPATDTQAPDDGAPGNGTIDADPQGKEAPAPLAPLLALLLLAAFRRGPSSDAFTATRSKQGRP